MRITGVTVEGVGRFSRSARIEGLHDGVNILVAPNEAGKSTLFKAIRACLFERHNSKNAFISSLQTEGSSLPVSVTVEFDHDGAAYVLAKTFLKSPSARLMRDEREIARNREADDMALELLGLTSASGRGAIDDAAFGLLWVGQKDSFDIPELSDAANSTLSAAIQAEVGNVVGSERARAILLAMKTELSPLITDSGKSRAGGPLAEAEQRLKQIEVDLAEAENRLDLLDAHLKQLTLRQQERVTLSDPAEIARERQELEEALRTHKAAESAAGILARYEADEREARIVSEREHQRLLALNERCARIDKARAKLAELVNQADPLSTREQEARDAIRLADARARSLNTETDELEKEERILRRMALVATDAGSRDTLFQRRRRLLDLGRRQVANTASLKANAITQAIIAKLDETERDLGVVNARLEAVAPRLSIAPGAAGQGRIHLDGAALTGETSRPVTEPVTIRIGDTVIGEIASITITPASATLQADLDQRHALGRRLTALLADHQMPDAAAMRVARARHQELEIEAKTLAAETRSFDLGQETAPAAAERLDGEITAIDAGLAHLLAELDLAELPSRDDIEARQKALQDRRDGLRAERAPLEGTIAAHNEVLAGLADQRGRLQGARAEIQSRLDSDVALLPDAERRRHLEEAEAACRRADDIHRDRNAALEAQCRTVPSADERERLRIRVTRLETARDNRNSRLGALERDIANLEGQIQSAGGDGIGEKLESLREQRDLETREVERHRTRVATLQLLRDTITASYKAQRDRLHAPLQRHLRPLINDVFPAGELELGDGFSVSGLRRDEPLAGDFDRLSAGTQEQIAVLVRLAMGSLIAERGQQVPIVLDDALVFSDDDRIERMFDALNRAGQKQQVIVLTCRTRTFARLGGNPLSISQDRD